MLNMICNISSGIWKEKPQNDQKKKESTEEKTHGNEEDEDFNQSNVKF